MLAYVERHDRDAGDALLRAVAAQLQDRGVAVAGAIAGPDAGRDTMALQLLPCGSVWPLAQDLGAMARGCRLDPDALARAAARVLGALEDGPGVVILNKFGKAEAAGEGFRGVIGEAMLRGIPVLTAVPALQSDAFARFEAGLAQRLPADPAALLAWHDAVAAP